MLTYFIHSPSTNAVKIGRSRNLTLRLKSLTTGTADQLVMLGTLEGDREMEFHHRFADCRIRGEWFSVTPNLADFLKAEFRCVLAEKQRRGMDAAPVESWCALVNRTEPFFGHGLRHSEYDDFHLELLDAEWKLEREEDDGEPDESEELEELEGDSISQIVFGLEDWWPWVKGWNLIRPEADRLAQLAFLFQKPDNERKLESLCRDLATFGDLSEEHPEFDLRVAICWRTRSTTNQWTGEIIGPVVIDDGPAIMSLGGLSAPILIDELFDFRLLGDSYYRRRSLPTPSEAALVPEEATKP